MGHHIEFVKERVEPDVLVDFLRSFLDGVASGADFDIVIGELSCSFPADVLERSALDLEYEHDPDKTELEITVEWRHEPPVAADAPVDEPVDEPVDAPVA